MGASALGATRAPPGGAAEGQLAAVDQSLGFLLLIIASVLLSFYSVSIQRRQAARLAAGDEEGAAALPDVFPIKNVAGATVIGALGFFFSLALQGAREAEQSGDQAAARSGRMNVWAALFVLAAAIIRFYDIHFVKENQQRLLAQDVLPD